MKHLIKGIFWLCLVVAGLSACNRYEDEVLPPRKTTRNILNHDNFSTYKNRPVRLNVFDNDSIVTDGVLIFGKPVHGTIISDSAGFVYKPQPNFQGVDQLSYKYCVGAACDSALVSIIVSDAVPNCSLKANPDQVSFNVPNPVAIPVLANDITCGPVSISNYSQPKHGNVTLLPNNQLQYTPKNGYIGADSLTYEIATPDGYRSNAVITITGYVNCTLFAKADLANTVTNDSVTIYPTQNDITCSMPLTMKIVGNPQHGTLKLLSNNRITYVPQLNYTGHDSFTYEICNGNNQCSQASVSVNVQSPVNCATGFTARNDSISFPVASAGSGVYLDVLANDIYCVNQLNSVTVTQQPVQGTVNVVMRNNVPQIHYVKFAGGSAPFSDLLNYQVCMLVNGQLVCRTASVKLNFY